MLEKVMTKLGIPIRIAYQWHGAGYLVYWMDGTPVDESKLVLNATEIVDGWYEFPIRYGVEGRGYDLVDSTYCRRDFEEVFVICHTYQCDKSNKLDAFYILIHVPFKYMGQYINPKWRNG